MPIKKLQKIISLFAICIIITSVISIFSFVSAQEESKIPAWIKTVVCFWVKNQSSDKEFLTAIKYFVKNEMIKVPSQSTDNEKIIEDL